MTASTAMDRDAPPAPEAWGPVLIGHLYWDVRAGRLYRLNDAARRLHEVGVPFLGSDPGLACLRTAAGAAIGAEDLPLPAALRQGRPTEATLVFAPPEKPPCQLHWNATPLRDAEGVVTGVMGTVCRTPPQTDSHTLAGLAHDLRTPLQTIRLVLAILGQRPLSTRQQGEMTERLQAAAERALQIASDLLDWCRFPSRGGRRAEFVWKPLEPLLISLLQERVPAAAGKGLALGGSLAEARGWEIYTDPIRLGRIITNLLVNAVRYTPVGGRVTLTASWQGQVGDRVLVLGVKDTGEGISPEEQESIFQPFERGRSSRGDSSGSGIGLAVVEELVDELGMRKELSSESGRGSTFRVLVPQRLLRLAPQSAAAEHSTPPPA
jgi:signal transduction histidine kinase